MQNSRLIISNQLFVAAYLENKLPSTTRLTKEISVPAILHIEENTLYYYSLADTLEKFDVFSARTCALLPEDI